MFEVKWAESKRMQDSGDGGREVLVEISYQCGCDMCPRRPVVKRRGVLSPSEKEKWEECKPAVRRRRLGPPPADGQA